MHPTAIPASKVAAIQRRYLDGETLRNIREAEDVAASTVQKYVKDLPRRHRGHLTPQTIGHIQTLRAKGQKQLVVARKLGLSISSVRKHERPDGDERPRRRGRPRKTAADVAR